MKQIIYFTLSIFLLFSCGTQKKTLNVNSIEDETVLVISYQQTSTYKNISPVYKIELYSNRQMYLTATKNLNKEGKFLRTLSEAEYNQVLASFNSANFFSFKDEYTTNMTDVPTHYLYYNSNGKEKKVKSYDNAPDELQELEYLMQSFLDRVGWEKMSW